MKVIKKTNKLRERRRKRTRMTIATTGKFRLSVARSNRHIYAQIIDDSVGRTLVSASSHEIEKKDKKIGMASAVGKKLAEKGKKAGIKKVIFDRGAYRYHGRVKALAESARSGGLEF